MAKRCCAAPVGCQKRAEGWAMSGLAPYGVARRVRSSRAFVAGLKQKALVLANTPPASCR